MTAVPPRPWRVRRSAATEPARTRPVDGSGAAAERLERAMAVALGAGAALFIPLSAGGFLAQYPVTFAPWNWFVAVATFGAPLLAAALSQRASVRTLHAVLATGSFGYLLGLALLVPAVGGTLEWERNTPWPFTACVIATSCAAVALRPRWAWPYLVGASTLMGVDRYLAAPFPILELAFQDALHNLLFNVVFAALAMAIRRAGRELDRTADAAIRETEAAAATEARRAERERVESLVHDSVIVALLASTRARSAHDDLIAAEQARRALVALDAAEIGPERRPSFGPRDFAYRAQSTATAIDPDAEFRYSIEGSAPVPADAADAGIEAAAEALRNTVRHAPGASHLVHLRVGDRGYQIAVLDDGPGFDPSAVGPARLGIRIAIEGRMAGIPGGSAAIASRPAMGTRVLIAWTRGTS